MNHPIPPEALKRHTAILGMTGSGKSSTGRLMVEEVVDQGHRVCILDTIKSDWWGITSSRSGKSPGLPFKILGGPRGHLPLHSSAGKAIGQLVGSGKLPLSIIDMADFEPGGLQRFFVEFVPALMRSMKGVVYLVIEEAHEVAPKERAGFGAENMAIHFAKKLGTGGRTKGIRLIVLTQRVQALHNAVLGSCETVIAHRIGFADDQVPVLKWMKAKIGKENAAVVEAELANLPDGVGFLASGAPAQIFERVKFPLFRTFDNTATPEHDAAQLDVKTAPVDPEELRAIIGDAVKEAEANDPAKLKAQIATLTAEKARLERQVQTASAAPTVNHDEILAAVNDAAVVADAAGYKRGFKAGFNEAAGQAKIQLVTLSEQARASVKNFAASFDGNIRAERIEFVLPESGSPIERPPVRRAQPEGQPASKPLPAASGDGTWNSPQRRILDSLAFWRTVGHESPRREQVAAVAGYSPGSGNFNNLLGGLKALGAIDYPVSGSVSLLVDYQTGLDADDARRMLDKILTGPQQKILEALRSLGSNASREHIAEASGYSAGSGNFNNLLGQLRTLCVIDYPRTGEAAITDWAAQVLG